MKAFDERIEEAWEEGQRKFWDSIKTAFPEIFTGDLSVNTSNEFNVACDIVVREWYKQNLVGCHTPSATYHALKQLQTEFPEMVWKDASYGNDASDSLECMIDEEQKLVLRVWMQNPEEGEDYKDFVVTEVHDEDNLESEDHAFEDFQQVIAYIRKDYVKPPRKPILWRVFDAKDEKKIKDATGYTFGNELPERAEDMVSVLISSGNGMWVTLNNKGQYFTIAGNDSALGTLEECIKCMDEFETVE